MYVKESQIPEQETAEMEPLVFAKYLLKERYVSRR
jgi:hypothetical protein